VRRRLKALRTALRSSALACLAAYAALTCFNPHYSYVPAFASLPLAASSYSLPLTVAAAIAFLAAAATHYWAWGAAAASLVATLVAALLAATSLGGVARVPHVFRLRDYAVVAVPTVALTAPLVFRFESFAEPLAILCIICVAGFGVGAAMAGGSGGRLVNVPDIRGLEALASWLSKHVIDLVVAGFMTAALFRAYVSVGAPAPAAVPAAAVTAAVALKASTKFRFGRVALLAITLALTAAYVRPSDVRSVSSSLAFVNKVLSNLGW